MAMFTSILSADVPTLFLGLAAGLLAIVCALEPLATWMVGRYVRRTNRAAVHGAKRPKKDDARAVAAAAAAAAPALDGAARRELAVYYVAIAVMQYQYTLWGQLAAREAGSDGPSLVVTIAVSQIGVCALYAIVLWTIGYNPISLFGLRAPTRQPIPQLTSADLRSMLPLASCYAAAHASGHAALTLGSHAFGQIVKAAEPVFSIVVSTCFYGQTSSVAKWCTIPLIVSGVALSTLKLDAAGRRDHRRDIRRDIRRDDRARYTWYRLPCSRYNIDFDPRVFIAGSVCIPSE